MEYSMLKLIHGSSIFLGLIGLYFVIRILNKWNNIDKDVLKARVFLNKDFLEKNWLYAVLTGAFLMIYHILEVFFENDSLNPFYEIFTVIALGFLVVLAYEWFKLIYIPILK